MGISSQKDCILNQCTEVLLFNIIIHKALKEWLCERAQDITELQFDLYGVGVV